MPPWNMATVTLSKSLRSSNNTIRCKAASARNIHSPNSPKSAQFAAIAHPLIKSSQPLGNRRAPNGILSKMMPAVASNIVRKPRALKPGSRIRIVSPASPIKEEKLAATTAILEGEGYVVERAAHVLADDVHLAGTDEQRAADLMEAFGDPTVNAILCSRGGYGCARLLPYLNLDKMASAGKLFLGYSDITTLHLALNRRGLPTVYSPMAISFTVDRKPWVIESFKRAFRGEIETPEDATRGETITPGTAEGIVTGGCLCLITDSLATPDSIDCEGKIVLIEDVDEAPHRVDAMLTHLINANQIQKAAGIVL